MEAFKQDLKQELMNVHIASKAYLNSPDIIVYDFTIDTSKEVVEKVCNRHQMYYDIICHNVTEITYSFWYNGCVQCNTNMGFTNPRQLCGKWRCLSK